MDISALEQFVVIETGAERYALRVSEIHEIIKLQKITEVPNSKIYLEGVTNLRGKIVPIINLRKRFHFAEEPHTKLSRIVVVNYREEIVGMIVDSVHQVITFSEVQPPGEIVSGADSQYFAGIGYTEEGLISILNIPHVLNG